MAPVGYKRVNKETGKEVPRENIVRGLQHQDGRYVVLSDEEIRSANGSTTVSAFSAQGFRCTRQQQAQGKGEA